MTDHTERTTPLTENMRRTLLSIHQCGRDDWRARLTPRDMTQAERNATTALVARGLVAWNNGLGHYAPTAAGLAVLDEAP